MKNISQKRVSKLLSVITFVCITFFIGACSINLSPGKPSIDTSNNDNESQSASDTVHTPTANPEEIVQYFDYKTIVINDILIGALDGEKWIDADSLYPMLPEKSLYDVYFGHYDSITSVGTKTVLPLGGDGIVMENADKYNDPLWHWLDYFALSSDEPFFFFITNKEHPGDPVFQSWADEICKESGHPDLKLNVREIHSIDINNDKIYFIIADNDYELAEKGRVQFVRMPVDGVEQNLKLKEEFWDGSYSSTIELVYVCDFNNDGVPEFITYTSGWIWGLYQVYSMQEGKYFCVLEAGWAD